ncbi:MAG: ABC transporter ATP-binding protein [Burkholderiales bacterium]|nr:ABC transporter ATP-binding protein [Burkholderiales bacterium]
MSALLAVEGVSKRFRGLLAVDDVSLSVTDGEIFAVIGPNGAGKTTLFNIIAGVYRPDGGRVAFAGQDITGLSPDAICAAGVARTFQIVRPFPGLSVFENALIGGLARGDAIAQARDVAGDTLRLMELWDKRNQKAGSLTLPDRKRLEVARALATGPRLLLLDEVMAGLRPTETDRMVAVLRMLNRDRGVTLVLIEHVMRAVMALAGRIHVLHHGATIAEGAPEAVTRDPAVITSYLGTETLG